MSAEGLSTFPSLAEDLCVQHHDIPPGCRERDSTSWWVLLFSLVIANSFKCQLRQCPVSYGGKPAVPRNTSIQLGPGNTSIQYWHSISICSEDSTLSSQ